MQDFIDNTSLTADLHSALQKYFDIDRRFAASYLSYFEKASGLIIRHVDDLRSLNDVQRMHMHYALSTNRRGEDVLAFIGQHHAVPARARCLDIGCCFGGVLVAAARRGYTAVGFEIEEERVAFARDNTRGTEPPVSLCQGDALNAEFISSLGDFDLITCNDVAEHVLDVPKLFFHIGKLMRPGGVLYMEIPNKDSISFVRSDGHFCLFGITQLPRPEAARYHSARFQHPYDVGDYFEFNEYRRLLAANGFERVSLVPSLYHPVRAFADYPSERHKLTQAMSAFRESSLALSADLKAEILSRCSQYMIQMDADYAGASSSANETAVEAFRQRYLRDFWTILAWKHSPRPESAQ